MCCDLHTASHHPQDKTGHSSVMCSRLCGPVDCLQAGLAMWAYNTTCWMDVKHTVCITVQVPLVNSFCRRRIYQLQLVHTFFSFLNTAKIHHRWGHWNLWTWLQKEKSKLSSLEMICFLAVCGLCMCYLCSLHWVWVAFQSLLLCILEISTEWRMNPPQ